MEFINYKIICPVVYNIRAAAAVVVSKRGRELYARPPSVSNKLGEIWISIIT